ncbi:MAG TPA: GNAT family N-acetyltransferase [Ktedonobacterales bacterium]|nr:GNAT family N-acetyltransferase [Ktedonobacterales bacterium]
MTNSDVPIAVVGQNPALIEHSLAVLQAGLGQGFITKQYFLRYVAPQPRKPFRRALVALDEATTSVLGVLTIEIVGAKALRASFLDSYELARADANIRLLRPGKTGLIKSIAVSPAHQGRGVATQLIAHGMKELANQGAEHLYSLAWVSGQSGCHLCGVLTALGFREIREIERFWYQDSLANGYTCLVCGHPCECAVRVMIQ